MSVQEFWYSIKKVGKYYISTNDNYSSRYLHKDGTIHDKCGSNNFWPTALEAQEFLNKCRGNWEFIKEDDMMI